MNRDKKNVFRRNYKFILGLTIGLMLASGGVYAAVTITGNNISYSNTKSGLKSTDVQGAIDELYEMANSNFVAAYTYVEFGSDKCITGEEPTCRKTTCYKNKTAGSCPSGTIIIYKVNQSNTIPFHVMFDDGDTMIMQGQDGIPMEGKLWNAHKIAWSLSYRLEALENKTQNWKNVNNQTYTLGTTPFGGTAYTGCTLYGECTENSYTLSERTGKARMITLPEIRKMISSSGYPKWLINNGNHNTGYWTMTADSSTEGNYFMVKGSYDNVEISSENEKSPTDVTLGVATKAVVEVSK